MKLKTNYVLEQSKVQGPGNRFTIWVQGCSIRCAGCNNKDTWDFDTGESIDTDVLFQQIIDSKTDGLTITGGEPLDQSEPVLELIKAVFPLKSVFLCSGYTNKKIQTEHSEILQYIDILCSGPFDSSKVCKSQWKGSSNQKITHFTTRGKLQLQLPVCKREYRINKHTGETILTGFSV